MSTWHGIRVTFGCGHMELRDAGYAPTRIGQLGACFVCPPHKRDGLTQARTRHVVDLAGVDAPAAPDFLGSEHWY
jgi:hypothetical protein